MSNSPEKTASIPVKNKLRKSKPWYRSMVQIFFFSLVTLISLTPFIEQAGMTVPIILDASLHAICPFGGVVSIYKFLTVGTFVQKIHESSFILMILAFILAIGFGPVICGWVCPFGTFQEWIGKIGRKIFKKKYNNLIPYKFDKYLRFSRYLLLAWVIYQTATTTKLIFQGIDPYYALFSFWTGEVAVAAYLILGLTILLSLFVERPWCKYACPYGAVLGVFNLFRIFKLRRNESTCIQCKSCDKSCPMNIPVSTHVTVKDHQCIACMKCTSEYSCPVPATVEFSTKGGTIK